MKKRIFVMILTLFLFFAFLPSSASASGGKRLDSVLGEYALTLVGQADKNIAGYEEMAKKMGADIIAKFKDRENELNEIIVDALTTGTGNMPLWDDIVNFAFPLDQKSTPIKGTGALKSALADVLTELPESIPLGDNMIYLGHFKSKSSGYKNYYKSSIDVPFVNQWAEGQAPEKIYFRAVLTDSGPLESGSIGLDTPYYIWEDYTYNGKLSSNNITTMKTVSKSDDNKTVFVYHKTADHNKLVGIQAARFGLDVPDSAGTVGFSVGIDVYYQFEEPKAVNAPIINFVSSSYLNNSTNDNYHIINGQVGDNVTVNHEFDKKYETFDDYGLRPDESAPTTGQSILSKLLDFMNGLGDLINKLVTALLAMVEKVVELFIPTAEQLAMMGDSVAQISEGLQAKFQGFTAIGESFTGVYSSPQSMLNMTIPTQQGDVELIPTYLHGVVGTMRSLLSGFSVIMTGIYIYKRIVGSGDVIEP